ncbi:MAG: M14 family zinc carboxypeptidase [Candidatus Cloacimonetes bacterium]|nr:M14 family zinc carboxypeptidase [Candidatus Cloacimonadota bacterium]
MNKLRKLSIVSILVIFGFLYAEKMVVRISNPSPELVKNFSMKNFDIASYHPDKYIDLVVDEIGYSSLVEEGFKPVITQTEAQLKENLSIRQIEGYRTYDEVVQELTTLAAAYPDICKLFNIGQSWGKIYSEQGYSNYDDYSHDIWALKVSDNVEIEEDEPGIYYMGAHHAREPISTEVTMTVLNHIIDNYGTDTEITDNVNNSQIWFIPIVNPDGHKVVLQEYDIWWRKNIRDNENNQEFNTYSDGVDPNRNYGFEWGLVGASDQFDSETYHGPSPFSEPEIQAVRDLLTSTHFVAGISYHSYGELVLFPYGYGSGVIPPDIASIQSLGFSMANSIPGQINQYYTPQLAWELYSCMGTTDDYAYGQHGIFSYTIELATEFIPPASQVQSICENNIEAAMILLNRINYSTFTGIITDAETGDPISATVFVNGIDDTGAFREPYKSSSSFGRYYRMVQPGAYSITFSAYGYQSVTMEGMFANESEQTTIDVQLYPAGNGTISGIILNHNNGLPVSEAEIIIEDSPVDIAFSDNNGSFQFVEIPHGDYQISIKKNGYVSQTLEIEHYNELTSLNISLTEALYFDNFEQDLANWVTTGNWNTFQLTDDPVNFVLTDSPQGSYNSNSNSYCRTSSSIEIPENGNTKVGFDAMFSIEEDYDYCYFQTSSSTANWITLDTFTGGSGWSFREYDLTSYAGNSLYFRFLFDSDEYVEEEGILIDNFMIYNDYIVDVNDNTSPEFCGKMSIYPNPFSNSLNDRSNGAKISFQTKNENELVNLSIYNIKGQLIKNLLNEKLTGKQHLIVWSGDKDNGSKCSSGVYLLRLKTESGSTTGKVIILK